MRKYGMTQRQMAAVSAKNHMHSVRNPRAYFRKPFTTDQVLAAKPIVYPLTVPMCAPVTDGGAAALLCTKEALGRYGLGRSRAIRVAACELVSSWDRDWGDDEQQPTCVAARRAYEAAGIGPEDIDVAEVHDATAFGEVNQVENLYLCEFGAGGEIAESGETTIGGRLPVNPSGGLESKGHPVAATGSVRYSNS
jgi:acetyl-CoA acetyltransferase